ACTLLDCYAATRCPPAFPTRRSSDLDRAARGRAQGPRGRRGEGQGRGGSARARRGAGQAGGGRGCEGGGRRGGAHPRRDRAPRADRKSTRLNSSHGSISYAVFCLKKK